MAVDLYRQKKHTIDEICKAVGISARHFTSMSRRLATDDDRSGPSGAASVDLAE